MRLAQFSTNDSWLSLAHVAIQDVVGEKSAFARMAVEMIEPVLADLADQLATGRIKPPPTNTMALVVDAESGGESLRVLYGNWDKAATTDVRRALEAGDPVVLVPLPGVLTAVLERLK